MLKVLRRRISYLKPESFIIVTALIGGGYAVLHKALSPSENNSRDEESKYIFLPTDKKGNRVGEFPFKTLQLTKSKRKKTRHRAVRLLARKTDLDESQMQMVAQAIDSKTAVGIARISGAELQFLLSPPSSNLWIQESLEHQFRKIFKVLPFDDSNNCAKYLIQQAHDHLKSYELYNNNCSDNIEETHSSIYYYRRYRPLPDSYIKKYLEAILEYSAIHSHQQLMVKSGLLKLLHDVRIRFQSNEDICSLIGKIISNLSLNDTLHDQIFSSGWVGILAKWMRSSTLKICLPAAKALTNLDRDYGDNYLEDGVFIFHPHYRESRKKKILADIVFVHGIMGSAFRTWRQHDKCRIDNEKCKENQKGNDNYSTNALSSSKKILNYTFCWPKDWLSHDVPFTRMIALDYDSDFVEWNLKCPLDKEKRSLKMRAEKTLEKLISAGIGDRPIIWISHSMGGILVKQVLVDASKSLDKKQKKVAENTAGLIFFSVPHFGSDVATLSHRTAMVLKPTAEAQIMKKDSPELLELHGEFIKFITENDVKILSFCETVKSQISKFHRKAILVPKDSADLGFGVFCEVPADHLSTCKPVSTKSSSYSHLVYFIRNVLSENFNSVQNDKFWKGYELYLISLLET